MKPPPAHEDIAVRLTLGGYPEAIERTTADRRSAWFASYISTIVQRDVRDLARVDALHTLPNLLKLLAARAFGLLNLADVGRDARLRATPDLCGARRRPHRQPRRHRHSHRLSADSESRRNRLPAPATTQGHHPVSLCAWFPQRIQVLQPTAACPRTGEGSSCLGPERRAGRSSAPAHRHLRRPGTSAGPSAGQGPRAAPPPPTT